MLTIGIIVLVGILYLLGWFGAAFWVIVFAIANGALAVVQATINPASLWQKQMQAGIEPGGLGPLYFHKAILISILVVAAWHVGGRAGYF